jgi:excinuclease ABC subunit A
LLFSEHHACAHCGISFPELTPQLFSFNSPIGMCPECNGLGTKLEVDPVLIVQDPTLSVMDGALRWYGDVRKKKAQWQTHQLNPSRRITARPRPALAGLCRTLPPRFDLRLRRGAHPLQATTARAKTARGRARPSALEGHRLPHQPPLPPDQVGVHAALVPELYERAAVPGLRRARACARGAGVTVGGKTLVEIGAMTIDEAHAWTVGLMEDLDAEQLADRGEVLKEIRDRLAVYAQRGPALPDARPPRAVALGRGVAAHPPGEPDRLRAGGRALHPRRALIGLHARDNRALLDTLLQLRDMGNTVLVVEHDEETMRDADWIIDLGPGAGVLGGEVVAAGTPAQMMANPAR